MKNNEAAHYNCEFWWKSLAPIGAGGGKIPEKCVLGSPLTSAINKSFGSCDNLINYFIAEANAFKGTSGWGWLVLNTQTKDLEIITTFNR